jgi:predicted DsbA family dithiol-disulfide isomerase
VFANQRALTDEDLKKYAAEVGLDTEAFNTCYDSRQFQADVQADHQAGTQVGIQGTPGFFVNGRFVNGAQPFEAFQAIIDEELAN